MGRTSAIWGRRGRWILMAWAVLVGVVASTASVSTGVFFLVWAAPLLAVSSIEFGICGAVRNDARRDYWVVAIVAYLPLVLAVLGGTATAAALGTEFMDALAGITFGLVGLAVVSAFIFTAIRTRLATRKSVGPIGLTFLAINTVVAAFVFPLVGMSLTGAFG